MTESHARLTLSTRCAFAHSPTWGQCESFIQTEEFKYVQEKITFIYDMFNVHTLRKIEVSLPRSLKVTPIRHVPWWGTAQQTLPAYSDVENNP